MREKALKTYEKCIRAGKKDLASKIAVKYELPKGYFAELFAIHNSTPSV